MGTSRWDEGSYTSYASARGNMHRDEIFTSRSIDSRMNLQEIEFREARDSALNPNSTPIIIGIDVTGSMGRLAEYLVKTGLGVMVSHILERRPVVDPAMCVVAIGDAECDRSPIQVGQFESDLVITEWLEAIHIEGGGGGNNKESYDMPYYFAINKTRTDSFEIRHEPGVLITIGDEPPSRVLKKEHVRRFIGDTPEVDTPFEELIESVRPMYTPYHITIAEGHYASHSIKRVRDDWREYLGNAALVLTDHRKAAELIVSMLEVDAGNSVEDAISIWDQDTARILRQSFADFVSSGAERLSRRMDVA